MTRIAETKAYNKILDVILSCKNEQHLEVARRMIENYNKLFPLNKNNHRELLTNLKEKKQFGLW